jgi:SIR2-like domain
MTEEDWELLLDRIRDGLCTPFLGAGAGVGTLPLGADIAREWADEFDYPLDDPHDLARVAQFLGVRRDPMFPKLRLCRTLQGRGPPDFSKEDEPHAAVASLPLPVFVTTNYDSFMVSALEQVGKDPKQDICRWNSAVKPVPGVLADDPAFVPTPANPLVFHLHGHFALPQSLVLTEDDYLDFLVAVSREESLLPHQIQRALAGSSLLFIGYRLADWDFRVLHRGLVTAGEPSLRYLSVTVQLPHKEVEQEYLDKYFSKLDLRVYWGSAQEFATELRERWDAFDGRG